MSLRIAYTDWITRMFYPNIVLGTVATMAVPMLVGRLVGGRTGMLVGSAIGVGAILVPEATTPMGP